MASQAASPAVSDSPNSWQQALLQHQAVITQPNVAQLTEKAILILFTANFVSSNGRKNLLSAKLIRSCYIVS